MQAIRLSNKNLHKIMNESPIQRRDLEAMIEDMEERKLPPYYFVPQHSDADELSHNSWMLMPKVTLDSTFNYDPSKIDNQFVEITPK